MMDNHFECGTDSGSTNNEDMTIGMASTDDEWELCTDDGFEDDVPMASCELLRIRTGDVDSLPRQDTWPAFLVPCSTFATVWHPFVVMPTRELTSVPTQAVSTPLTSSLVKLATSITTNPETITSMRQCLPLPSQDTGEASSELFSDDLEQLEAGVTGEPLCGSGNRCRPCYNHIRGKCANGAACTYCHESVHAIRRKQRKHQRRAQMIKVDLPSDSEVTRVKPGCSSFSQHHQCQPCFRYIRGLCTLGAACLYSHDPVHAQLHKQRKQTRCQK